MPTIMPGGKGFNANLFLPTQSSDKFESFRRAGRWNVCDNRVDGPWTRTRRWHWYFVNEFLHISYFFRQLSLYHNSAKEYQIKYSEVFDYLMDNNFNSNLSVQFGQQDVLDGSLQPLESGSKQSVSLALPKASQNVTYYIALRAINNKNLASNTSNVVSVQIAIVQQPETQPPTTKPTATPTMSTTWSPDTTTTAGIHFKLLITS